MFGTQAHTQKVVHVTDSPYVAVLLLLYTVSGGTVRVGEGEGSRDGVEVTDRLEQAF